MPPAGGEPDQQRSPKDWRRLARSLPPIARREEELRALREERDRLRRSLPRRGAGPERWAVPRADRAFGLVRNSGLFDPAWYRTQVDLADDGDDACVRHYVREGAALGLSPHPAFVGEWYVGRLRRLGGYAQLRKVGRAPLLHYLTVGAARQVSPHPGFDPAQYAQEHPEASREEAGPLAYFLREGVGEAQDVADDETYRGTPEPRRRGREEFLASARAAAEAVRDSRGHGHEQRESESHDDAAEERLKAGLLNTPLEETPLVSVVIPTKDRAEMVSRAVASVLAQTYPHWQLVLVDDGSEDGTREALSEALADPRVVYVRHDTARGVAAARNSGLQRAEGRYVAYLDSDNTWHPDFLELMVRFMTRGGHRAAYAMSRLVDRDGRVLYRGREFSREALREQNYIDCIVLVHERELLEAAGGFDETLRRNVDWELFIRLADQCDFAYLPVVATEYDVWEERTDRITTEEPFTYRFVVRQRALVDWRSFRARTPGDEGVVSVVLAATGEADLVASAALRAVRTATSPVDVVIVDSRMDDGETTRLRLLLEPHPEIRVHRLTQELPVEVARNVGATLTRGDTLVFLDERAWCEPGWDGPLVEALDDFSTVQPVLLDEAGTVWCAGLAFLDGGHAVRPYGGLAGDAPEVRRTRRVDAAANACVAVRTVDFGRVEGFDPLHANHHEGGGLSLRVSAATGREAACAGASTVALREPLDPEHGRHAKGEQRHNARLQRDRWGGRPSTLPDLLAEDGYRMLGLVPDEPPSGAGAPLLVHDRPERPLRWAIKIGAPDVPERQAWGDWHFAEALRDSLTRLGHEVAIDCHDAWYRPSGHLDDVVLALRGITRYDPNPLHTNLLWVISHPDRVTTGELESFDGVFGASGRWCRRVSRTLGRPVAELLQCTDHRRFHPVEPDPQRRHDVLVVANARGKGGRSRPGIDAALSAGVVPAVYGERWGGVLPPHAWKGHHIPNDELPAVYAAAGVVLNDHWEDMREEGLLSNRLFDLAACNARVLSDHLPEIPDVFGDAVLTWRTADEIPAKVRMHLEETEDRRRAREELGERVRREHTFDARARELSAHVRELRAQRTPAP